MPHVVSLIQRIFIMGAAALLFFTAAAKLYSSSTEIRILGEVDQFFGFLTNRQLLLVTATLEIFVAVTLCRKSVTLIHKLGVAAWVATLFFAYRIGQHLLGITAPCACLGHIAQPLGLSATSVDMIMKSMLGFLLVGSYGLLLLNALNYGNWRISSRIEGETGS